MQKVFESCPPLLAYAVGAAAGPAWVFPQKRLGSHYVPDFLVAYCSSAALNWVAIEIESPRARVLDRKGDPTKAVYHAIGQIQDWRTWLGANLRYATAGRDDEGLGLSGIDPNVEGLVIIGRRNDNARWQTRREQFDRDLKDIRIRSYDSVNESATQYLKMLKAAASR